MAICETTGGNFRLPLKTNKVRSRKIQRFKTPDFPASKWQ
jgi:hypothetical protein